MTERAHPSTEQNGDRGEVASADQTPEDESDHAGRLTRLPNSNIEAPDGYIEYDGQVIIKTRYATVQRWKKAGWDDRRRSSDPYLLTDHYCTGPSEVLKAKHDHLDVDEVEVYYTDRSTRLTYMVERPDE